MGKAAGGGQLIDGGRVDSKPRCKHTEDLVLLRYRCRAHGLLAFEDFHTMHIIA